MSTLDHCVMSQAFASPYDFCAPGHVGFLVCAPVCTHALMMSDFFCK